MPSKVTGDKNHAPVRLIPQFIPEDVATFPPAAPFSNQLEFWKIGSSNGITRGNLNGVKTVTFNEKGNNMITEEFTFTGEMINKVHVPSGTADDSGSFVFHENAGLDTAHELWGLYWGGEQR